jgi:AbrB family looped-hinge helix DNA binding protein
MRMTTKGQVTIPQHIREKLGLLPWTEVEFTLEKNGVRIAKKAGSKSRGERLLEAMRKAPKPMRGMTTDQLMAMTRGED